MQKQNEYLATTPFDLYQLNLFNLVARTSSFTKAAQQAGLTQSAITRQIGSMESSLGIALFERTTRHVALTAAGRLLLERAKSILDSTDDLLKQLQQDFNLVPTTLRIGVARSIGLSYLPGFFFAFQKHYPSIPLCLSQATSDQIIASVQDRNLDAGLICPPRRLPTLLQVTHKFRDAFTFIAPPHSPEKPELRKGTLKEIKRTFRDYRWLLLDQQGNTGKQLHRWMAGGDCEIEPAMELDSFDMIVNLVSLGLGVSIVPHRVLPLYLKRRSVRRISIKNVFQRELGVIVRKNRTLAEPLRSFVESILF
ncbi:MAG TPA: LysR family transcriptional regulator [Candidatus Saccharimonadales bacterium]|nr:LysR family transcriptional regulator [Candidatus Saccharimonadales bacterium]